jgi:hypothetical protein
VTCESRVVVTPDIWYHVGVCMYVCMPPVTFEKNRRIYMKVLESFNLMISPVNTERVVLVV